MFLITSETASRETLAVLARAYDGCEMYADNAIEVEHLSSMLGIVRALAKGGEAFYVQPWE